MNLQFPGSMNNVVNSELFLKFQVSRKLEKEKNDFFNY